MEESLRRAYLAAMEIPVWIPRDAEDPWDGALELSAQAQAPAANAAGAAPARVQVSAGAPVSPDRGMAAAAHARAILGELDATPRRAPASAAVPAVPRAVAPAARQDEHFTLLFARAGGTLFIDDSAGERPGRRELDLLAALAFVLEREKLQPEVSPFRWPPHPGRAAGQARDGVLGRIAKLAETMALKRLVLMGDAPVGLLLGDGAHGRVPRVHAIERLGAAVLAIPSLARMLADPQAKRIAWQTLRLPHG